MAAVAISGRNDTTPLCHGVLEPVGVSASAWDDDDEILMIGFITGECSTEGQRGFSAAAADVDHTDRWRQCD